MNDSSANAPLVSIIFDDYTEAVLFRVCPAICHFIGRLKEIPSDANIVFIINTKLKPEIGETVKAASENFGMSYIELHDIDKLYVYPTNKGMAQINEQIKEFIYG